MLNEERYITAEYNLKTVNYKLGYCNLFLKISLKLSVSDSSLEITVKLTMGIEPRAAGAWTGSLPTYMHGLADLKTMVAVTAKVTFENTTAITDANRVS